MKNLSPVIVDGESLTIEKLILVARGRRAVYLPKDSEAVQKLIRSRAFYLASDIRMYGDRLAVGANDNIVIPEEKRIPFQENLINSLSCGIGRLIHPEIVRGIMLLRVNAILHEGCSAIGPDKVLRIIQLLNCDVLPIIHRYGSVGASGDLVPLAALAAVVRGSGKAWYQGRIRETADVLCELRLEPLVLREKEGLSLVNGTSAMTSMAAFAWYDACYFVKLALACTALSFEASEGITDSLHPFVHSVKPHPGQQIAARDLRLLLEGSALTKDIDELRAQVERSVKAGVLTNVVDTQKAYSQRCSPHVFSPVLTALREIKKVIMCEMNSANDNPVVNFEEKKIHHTGNFSGFDIADAMDRLKQQMGLVADLMFAVKERILDARLNEGLPPSLAGEEPGFNSGLKGVGLCGTDVYGEAKFLAQPYAPLRRATESMNQDIVSFGFGAARQALALNEALTMLLAITLLTVTQAADLRSGRDPAKLDPRTRKIYEKVRSKVAFVGKDRPLDEDLEKLVLMIQNREFDLDSIKI
ncbi:MAG: aromatic amino acid lyase [Candidatus Sungbacteria bacterium]|nr:aromatic amino acid lyase [Candidatus Sungbacteria bacterium]